VWVPEAQLTGPPDLLSDYQWHPEGPA
jgi:hypothetical protein